MIIQLIRFLGDSHNYSKYNKFIKKDYLPSEVQELLHFLPEYFKTELEVSDWQAVLEAYTIRNPSSKKTALIQKLVERIKEDLIHPIAPDVIQILQNRYFAESIMEECFSITEGKKNTLVGVQNLLVDYKRESVSLESDMKDHTEEDILESLETLTTTGFDWWMPCLNKLLGPLSSEFIILASRPDGGKTTFLAHTSWWVGKQLSSEKVVLWFNNEEAINKIKARVVQSACGITQAVMFSDRPKYARMYESIVGRNKIIFVDDSHDIKKIERTIAQYNPGLIIIDQLYKVQGNVSSTRKDSTEAERFRSLCGWGREIAKHTAPVIVSNQLDSRAEGQRFPSMDCLYGSKTGAQGEADALIMIGRIPTEPENRYIHTPKNKLTGETASFQVKLDRERARYFEEL